MIIDLHQLFSLYKVKNMFYILIIKIFLKYLKDVENHVETTNT